MTDEVNIGQADTNGRRFKPRLASNLLLWGVLGFCVAGIGWAATTEIDRTVRGQGRVIPSSQLQIVSNLEGGVVDDILIKTGDSVSAGTALIQMSPIIGTSELGSGQASIEALVAKSARLEAEVAGTSPVFVGAGADVERTLYNARQAELRSLAATSSAQVEQARRAVSEAQSVMAARQAQVRQAQSEINLIGPLVAQGYEPRLSLVKIESQLATARSEVSAASASVGRANAQIAEAQANYSRQVQDWRSRAANELSQVRAELSARRKTLPALADRVRRTTITAPVAGKINRVMVTTKGATATPGSPLVEIVPSEDNLLIEAMIMPQDIGTVRMNQKATINISAYDSAVYGKMTGKVISISPDAIVNEKTGESFYLVRVRTDTSALVTPKGQKLAIGPGMTAEVDLLGDKRAVLSYLFTPVSKVSGDAFRE
jgi:membrane fusion protein, adhesin transport system